MILKKVVIVFLLGLPVTGVSDNLGHRLGADSIKYLPENSLQVLRAVLPDIQFHKSFHYVEFDVRETADEKLIVFHDSNFKRMVKKEISKTVKNTSFSDVKKFCLKASSADRCYKIPTPEEVLLYAHLGGLTKPVMIEIKDISEKGKEHLLAIAERYKDRLKINFIISKKRFSKLFTKDWCSDFSNKGFYVMQTGKIKKPEKNNLCLAFLK